MPEYPVIGKEGIVYFIYKAIPLLFINADKKTVYKVINQYISKVSNAYARHMLYLYLYRFNSHFIKLVTLKLYNYNSLEKIIIKRIKKRFIKCLNIMALNTASTPIRICFIYALYIIGLNLNQLTTFESVVVIYTKQ